MLVVVATATFSTAAVSLGPATSASGGDMSGRRCVLGGSCNARARGDGHGGRPVHLTAGAHAVLGLGGAGAFLALPTGGHLTVHLGGVVAIGLLRSQWLPLAGVV